MATYGRQVLDTTGRPIEVSADGRPTYKSRGLTIDWETVDAVVAETVLDDETVVPAGGKYLRFGQIVTRKGTAETQTYTWTGGPTAGAAILTLPATDAEPEQSTVELPFDATAAQVQSALEDIPRIGEGGVVVTRSGSGTAGAPYVYSAVYKRELGDLDTLTATHTFTGGTTPTVTVATGTPGVGDNKFGPYDSAATDGRATLSRGDVYILNKTVLESDTASDHPPAMDGGLMWKQRILMTTGTHSLAAGPTVTEFLAAFPEVRFAE